MEPKIKVLVTGANGFIGKNLCAELLNRGYEVVKFGSKNTIDELREYTKNCDYVVHLAGANRPTDIEDFMKINAGLTKTLLQCLKENNNNAPVLMSSSIQAELDNDYGRSKKLAEDFVFEDAMQRHSNNMVFRLPNIFGKWCKPNYNSVVATFCNNIANDIDIVINDNEKELILAYIDDVVEDFIDAINGKVDYDGKYAVIHNQYRRTLKQIADLIYSFRQTRDNYNFPKVDEIFGKKLYSTYLSYLPEDRFIYDLNMHVDDRGSFTEILKGTNGQVSVNVVKPNITKGNHWHHTKNEKFIVLGGEALISLRKINSEQVLQYRVSGEHLQVVDIPVGYTHNIKNIGDKDVIFLIWANEIFDKEKPDTYYLTV